MKKLIPLLTLFSLGAFAFGQSTTLKTLSYNPTNGVVQFAGNDVLSFNSAVKATGLAAGDAATNVPYGTVVAEEGVNQMRYGSSSIEYSFDGDPATNYIEFQNATFFGAWTFSEPVKFFSSAAASGTRSNLGLPASWLTNTNVSNFRTAVGLSWSALTNTNAATALLGYSTNGQVVYSGTNVLMFTNEIKVAAKSEFTRIVPLGSPNSPGINLIDQYIEDTNGMFGIGAEYGIGSFRMYVPISFHSNSIAATTRANLGFSTNLNTLWTATNESNARSAVGLSWSALTNTNASTALLGFTTNGQVVYSGTNALTFTNGIKVAAPSEFTRIIPLGLPNSPGINLIDQYIEDTNGMFGIGAEYGIGSFRMYVPISFHSNSIAATTRANLGFSTNLNTLWTATNESNARSAVGLSWSALTNTNSATELLGYKVVDMDGETANAIIYTPSTNLTYNQLWFSNATRFDSIILGTVGQDEITMSATGIGSGISLDPQKLIGDWEVSGSVSWTSNSFAATTRANLGLPLPALTNTSNVTMMRALAGSTNSAHPFSGSFKFIDADTSLSYEAVVSNGIIISITEY